MRERRRTGIEAMVRSGLVCGVDPCSWTPGHIQSEVVTCWKRLNPFTESEAGFEEHVETPPEFAGGVSEAVAEESWARASLVSFLRASGW
eukprot:6174307-Pleurochrysis_carterae.AAC.3